MLSFYLFICRMLCFVPLLVTECPRLRLRVRNSSGAKRKTINKVVVTCRVDRTPGPLIRDSPRFKPLDDFCGVLLTDREEVVHQDRRQVLAHPDELIEQRDEPVSDENLEVRLHRRRPIAKNDPNSNCEYSP